MKGAIKLAQEKKGKTSKDQQKKLPIKPEDDFGKKKHPRAASPSKTSPKKKMKTLLKTSPKKKTKTTGYKNSKKSESVVMNLQKSGSNGKEKKTKQT